jgi:hypothetical protein
MLNQTTLAWESANRKHPEDDLQRAVVDFLEVSLPQDAIFFHCPNGGLRSKKVAARLSGLGVKAGIPDLILLHRQRTYFIELKAKHGTFSAAQRAMERRLIYAGYDVCLCKSVPEVEAALRAVGVPLRGSVAA